MRAKRCAVVAVVDDPTPPRVTLPWTLWWPGAPRVRRALDVVDAGRPGDPAHVACLGRLMS